MHLCVCVRKEGLGQERVFCVRVAVTIWNTLNEVGTEKRGGETKISKRWGQAGSRGGYLKKASCEKHCWMMPNVFTTILSIKGTLDTLPWLYTLTLDMLPKNLKRKEGEPFNHYTELVSPKIFRSSISDINGFSNNKTDSIAYLAILAFQNQKAKIVI